MKELQINLCEEDFEAGLQNELGPFWNGKAMRGCPVVIHYQGGMPARLSG